MDVARHYASGSEPGPLHDGVGRYLERGGRECRDTLHPWTPDRPYRLLAPNILGTQNIRVQGVGCGTASVSFNQRSRYEERSSACMRGIASPGWPGLSVTV